MPVYNSEKYLEKCFKSIISQSFKNYEVIVVNDGSTDNSAAIISKYSEKYPNFKGINLDFKTNVSDCRNRALKIAQGDYIAFCDSDDYISPNFLEILYKNAKKTNADIVCCGHNIVNEATGKVKSYKYHLKPGIYENPKALKTLINDTRLNYYIWDKLFKREILFDNNIDFPEILFEDTIFSIKAFYFSKKISVIPDRLYYYVRHNNSLVNTISIKTINDYLTAFADTRTFLEANGDFAAYEKSFRLHSIRILSVTLKNIYYVHKKNKNFKNIFKNSRHIISAIHSLTKSSPDEIKDITEFYEKLEI